jgi:hypothetical protein
MKHKYGLGDRVSFDRRYMKNGFINPEDDNDSRVVLNDESGRASITKWSELKLDKPMKGIVVGIRKITLASWYDWLGGCENGHWENVGKDLEGQVYVIATDMSHTWKVAEAWMVAI